MSNGKAIIFSAPSGAGKTTIVRHLMGLPGLHLAFSVSATTRAKRDYEKDGVDYYFISADEFLQRARNGEFIEWEEVYTGQYYGTLKSEIERIWARGEHVIFDLDVVGGLNLKKILGERALAVFVKPPSIDTLVQRLEARSTETPEKIAQRVAKAHHEMEYEPRFDTVVINDDLTTALREAEERVSHFLQQP
ncbi:MAG: guanylate kinase [Flavobacteriales bacterium]|jgi:guanylate kinase